MAEGIRGPRGALCFAAGEFGANLTWNMISGFILFYYSNVVLLPVAAIGTMLLLTRVLDAVIDPAIGILVDRTRTRWGRARPYLIAATVPFVAVTYLTFSVPDWSLSHKLVYAYATFTAAGILFSLLYIPYNAMVPLITSDPVEKLRISSYRAMASAGGSILMFSTFMPLVAAFGGENRQRGFSVVSAIMGTGTALTMILVFKTTAERPLDVVTDLRHGLSSGIGTMFRNSTWLIVAAFALFLFVRLGTAVSSTAYFAGDVLGRPTAVSWLFSSLSVAILLGGFVTKPYLARLGLRNGNILSLALALALTLAMVFSQTRIWLFGALYFMLNISIGIQTATMFVLVADSVDAQENLSGQRMEGLLTSTVSLTTKVGMAIGGSIIAYGLAYVDYHPTAVTAAAREQIQLLYFGGPALFALLQMLVIALYKPVLPRRVASTLGTVTSGTTNSTQHLA